MIDKIRKIVAKENVQLIILLVLYCSIGLLIMPYYRHTVSPDGVTYFSITKKYLQGEFSSAVNGYWGPLISWLLIPFFVMGIPSVLSAKILFFIVGFITLIGTWKLSVKFPMLPFVRFLVNLSLIPLILTWAYITVKPDLILACVFLFYLLIVLDEKYRSKKYFGIYAGVFATLAYFCKLYGFYIILLHFFIFNFLFFVSAKSKKIVVFNFIAALLTLFILSAPWIYLISVKYNKFTPGTTGSVNYAFFLSPDAPESENMKLPVYYKGFLKPYDTCSLSAWDDPTYIDVSDPVSIETYSGLMVYINRMHQCLQKVDAIYNYFFFLGTVVFWAYVVLCILPIKKIAKSYDFYLLLTFILYPAGYYSVGVCERFIIINLYILIIMAGRLFSLVMNQPFMTRARSVSAYLIFIIILVYGPISIKINTLHRFKNSGRYLYRLAEHIKSLTDFKGRVASNENWYQSIILSYYLDQVYHGAYYRDTGVEEMTKDILDADIDYYFVWASPPPKNKAKKMRKFARYSFLSRFPELTKGKTRALKVYDLRGLKN